MNAPVKMLESAALVKAPKKIFCVSDLHMGMPISSWWGETDLIEEGFAWADEAWLLGDVFEATFIKESIWKDPEKKAKYFARATDWLQRWHNESPDCHKIIIWGNHEFPKGYEGTEIGERCKEFREYIKKYIQDNGLNYHVNEEGYIAAGDVVAVHGHEHETKKDFIPHPLLRNIYVWGLRSINGDRLASINPPENWVKKIIAALPEEVAKKMKHLIFGHIHNPFIEKEIELGAGDTAKKVWASNTGASLVFRPDVFNPICFEFDGDNSINFQSFKKMMELSFPASRYRDPATIRMR